MIGLCTSVSGEALANPISALILNSVRACLLKEFVSSTKDSIEYECVCRDTSKSKVSSYSQFNWSWPEEDLYFFFAKYTKSD
jgi:hypothetical protein